MITKPTHQLAKPLMALGILCLLFLGLVWPGRNSPLFFDDESGILYAQEMTAKGISPVASMAYKDAIVFYRPIKNLTFGLIAESADPTNTDSLQQALTTARTIGFSYCIAAAFGVFALIRRITKNEWMAVTAAGFWLLSAAGTSTAIWVSAQNIALAVAFSCCAFVTGDKFLSAETRRRKVILGTSATILYALGLLCYDSAVAIPGMFVAYIAWLWLNKAIKSTEIRNAVTMLVLWSAATAGWLYVRHQVGATSGRDQTPLFSLDATRFDLFAASAWFFWRHLTMWLWPFGTLEIGGVYLPGKSASTATLIGSWFFLLGYFGAIVGLFRHAVKNSSQLAGLIALGLVMGFIGAFPSGNFIPLYAGPMGDYYTMVPGLGWSLALTATVFLLASHLPGLRASEGQRTRALLAVALLAVISVSRIAGAGYIPLLAARYKHPIEVYWASNDVRPCMALNQVMIGRELNAYNKPAEALPYFEAGFQTAPWLPRNSYAFALEKLGRYEDALAQCEITLATKNSVQDLLAAYHNKAMLLQKLHRFSEGKDVVQRVIHNTHYREHRQLVATGILIAHQAGDDETARRWLNKGREAYPADPIIEEAAAKAGL